MRLLKNELHPNLTSYLTAYSVFLGAVKLDMINHNKLSRQCILKTLLLQCVCLVEGDIFTVW